MVNAQAGGLGLHGAFTYIGASAFSYRCAEALGEYRSSRPSRLVSENGQRFVDYDVGLQCRVNGKPGRAWTLSPLHPNEAHDRSGSTTTNRTENSMKSNKDAAKGLCKNQFRFCWRGFGSLARRDEGS